MYCISESHVYTYTVQVHNIIFSTYVHITCCMSVVSGGLKCGATPLGRSTRKDTARLFLAGAAPTSVSS